MVFNRGGVVGAQVLIIIILWYLDGHALTQGFKVGHE